MTSKPSLTNCPIAFAAGNLPLPLPRRGEKKRNIPSGVDRIDIDSLLVKIVTLYAP